MELKEQSEFDTYSHILQHFAVADTVETSEE